jgi:rod shape-determining protein MreC
MQQIIKFLLRFQVGILFLILFSIAIALTINAHSYHQEKFLSSTNVVSSFFYNIRYDIISYFNLKKENEALQDENSYLQKALYNASVDTTSESTIDTSYTVIKTKVIRNSFNKLNNYVLIEGGTNDSIKKNYGVSLPNGILGIVDKSSKDYSRVISILNTKLLINAKFKNNFQFGSLQWDGESHEFMNLNDIPRSAKINIGDTIVTGGNSLIFPKDILIGRVERFALGNNLGYYTLLVKLFADMTNLNEAYIIVPKKIKQAQELIE